MALANLGQCGCARDFADMGTIADGVQMWFSLLDSGEEPQKTAITGIITGFCKKVKKFLGHGAKTIKYGN